MIAAAKYDCQTHGHYKRNWAGSSERGRERERERAIERAIERARAALCTVQGGVAVRSARRCIDNMLPCSPNTANEMLKHLKYKLNQSDRKS